MLGLSCQDLYFCFFWAISWTNESDIGPGFYYRSTLAVVWKVDNQLPALHPHTCKMLPALHGMKEDTIALPPHQSNIQYNNASYTIP